MLPWLGSLNIIRAGVSTGPDESIIGEPAGAVNT